MGLFFIFLFLTLYLNAAILRYFVKFLLAVKAVFSKIQGSRLLTH